MALRLLYLIFLRLLNLLMMLDRSSASKDIELLVAVLRRTNPRGTVAFSDGRLWQAGLMPCRYCRVPASRSSFAGFPVPAGGDPGCGSVVSPVRALLSARGGVAG